MTSTTNDAAPASALARLRHHPVLTFVARRLWRFVVSLWIVATAAFLMIHLIPGDPVRAALGINAPAELVESRREALGLNDPLLTQYWHYLTGVLRGEFGTSTSSGVPVAQVIGERLPATVEIAVLAFVVIIVIAVPLGASMAILTRGGRNRVGELAFTSASVVLAAIPEFLLAVGLVYVFAVSLSVLPVAGRDAGPPAYVLPVVSLALGPTAVLARIVRVEMLTVLGNDYIRTARAKRLPPPKIYFRHALPNALTATLTLGGLLLTGLVAGTLLVENVFAWPGLGSTIISSILTRDYPLVQGIVLVYGAMVLLVTLAVDLLLALLDPRSTIGDPA